ncbi:ribonuclease H-like domain-containing protein [Tanacetum coccineum]
MKGIKREFSVARTLQQNRVAERENRTLIEVARTMLADSKLPTTFWAEAVNAACYVQNRVLVIKPHNKTPYELFLGRKPALSFMRPFGRPVTILNTIDHLGKFDRKADEGFFVGYSTNSKAFRVFNSRTRIVEENLHVQFSENTSNVAESKPNWLFYIDALTNSMNYKPVVAGNQSNGNADPPFSSCPKDSPDARFKPLGEEEMKGAKDPGNEGGIPSTNEPRINQEKDASVNNTNNINIFSPTVNVASIKDNAVDENIVYGCADDPNIPDLEEIDKFSDAENDDSGADIKNLDTYFQIVCKILSSKLSISDSLLLTPLCCDDIHDVTPRVSALAGCDRLVSEPLVIENYVSLIRKKFCWGTIFLIGLKRYSDPKEEPIKKEPLMELKEIG